MIEYVRDEALPDREEILVRLASHDRDVVLRMLTLLCPCRNACYDAEIWETVEPIWSSHPDGEVREAAFHAFATIRDRSRVDMRSRRLLDELAAKLGRWVYPQWFRLRMKKGVAPGDVRYPKAAIRDVPTLIEQLSSGDEVAARDAIAALCPDNGRHAPKKVWRAIVETRRSPDLRLREKADIAAHRLDAHAMNCDRRHE
ncbi:MAG TPA: hypothetical protein VK197_06635 [Verrucomicrobiae bacterium]|nr:hypothetical protein [Verrucomicrobiae bacterium]